MKPATVPNRLAVYQALCQLSPQGYSMLARMILSTGHAEPVWQQRRQTRRRNARHVVRAGNIGKPVITLMKRRPRGGVLAGLLRAVPCMFAPGAEAHERTVVGGSDNCPVGVAVGAFDKPGWARWQGRRGLRLRHNRPYHLQEERCVQF